MKKMYPEERLIKILDIIKRDFKVDVEGLTGLFRVTGATIRSDLQELESRNLIIRTHGGALLKENLDETLRQDKDPSYETRANRNKDLKEAIGKTTARFLQDGDSITIDDGSTTLHVARHLPKDKKLHVLTNGLSICLELLHHPNVDVFTTGGNFDREDLCYYGRVTEEIASRFYTNRAILGASGISPEYGVTAPNEQKAELKKVMIEHCYELFIVADHTKINRNTLFPICTLEKVNTLIVDSQAPEDMIERIRNCGVKVVLAE